MPSPLLHQRRRHPPINMMQEGKKLRLLEEREQKQTKAQISKMHTNSSNILAKIYLCMVLVMIVLLICVMLWVYRDTLWSSKPPPKRLPPITLISALPLGVSPRHDFIHFYGTLVYSTLENKLTREAIKSAIRLEQVMQAPHRNPHVSVRAFEQEELDRFVTQLGDAQCGTGFSELYHDHGILFEQERDLYIWCILASGFSNGYVDFDLNLDRSFGEYVWNGPHSGRNISNDASIVVDFSENGTHDKRMSSVFMYFHDPMSSTVPREMLTWLKEVASQVVWNNAWEYRQTYEEHLYDVILRDETGNKQKWTRLKGECSLEENINNFPRLARSCYLVKNDQKECCNILAPVASMQQVDVPSSN